MPDELPPIPSMPAAVKFAWRTDWPSLRLRAEFPLPAEQLSPEDLAQVVNTASRVLLRDAFGEQ